MGGGEVAEQLLRDSARHPATSWPADTPGLEQAGLYAWYVDPDGAADLSNGLGLQIQPGLIYVGQTGATLWPSGKRRESTLAQRLGRNHIGGHIGRSTFRRTLAASLASVYRLEYVGPKQLAAASEAVLSRWIRQHLAFSIYPTDDRDNLAELEHQVVVVLDPPLNLDGCPDTPLRTRLTRLRHARGLT